MTEGDLCSLIDNDVTGDAIRSTVTGWASFVLRQETLRLTDVLVHSEPVTDGLDEGSVTSARGNLWPDDDGDAATLLVASTTSLDEETKTAIRRALKGGAIVKLPVTREQLGGAALLTAPHILKSVRVFVAIDFELGWNPDSGAAVIHLNRRTSDFVPPDATPACVPINPPAA